MKKLVEKRGFLGHQKIVLLEGDDDTGEYSYCDGEWIWHPSSV